MAITAASGGPAGPNVDWYGKPALLPAIALAKTGSPSDNSVIPGPKKSCRGGQREVFGLPPAGAWPFSRLTSSALACSATVSTPRCSGGKRCGDCVYGAFRHWYTTAAQLAASLTASESVASAARQ